MSKIDSLNFPVLLVDDEVQALNSFETVLRTAQIHNCIRCQDSREVLSLLETGDIEVILLDLRMPYISGEELLPTIRSEFPEIPVIVITGANDVETAVTCMKFGAFDYILKPVEKSRLISAVKRAIELRELKRENRLLKDHVLYNKLKNPDVFSTIITRSRDMRAVFQYVEAIASSPQPVTITGETGVGKEMIAQAIHQLSRHKAAFVPVNAAGVDEHAFTDTLFGHKKGAFTGADSSRQGMVEKASGGTLFLDEIGDLSADSQVKLLRLLAENEYLPLGADIAKRANARVVVATNRNLQTLQSAGKFRKDLYYRLSSHHVHIPPLRDRKEDLPLLLEYFLELTAAELAKKKPAYPNELLDLLASYHFPGNVRELQGMIWDAVSNHRHGVLALKVFKTHITKAQSDIDMEASHQDTISQHQIVFTEQLPTLKEAEHLLISEALKRSGNNQAVAAMHLGITRQALNRRLKHGKFKDLP